MDGEPLYLRIARSTVATDWAATRWIGPLRISIVATALALLAVELSGPPVAFPLAVGAIFAGLSDLRGNVGERLRGMFLTGVSISVAATVGVLISPSFPVQLAVTAVGAAICGYVGVAGPRATLAGLLSLVILIVFGGTPAPINDAVPAGAWMLLGSLIMIAVVFLPLLAGRIGGVRTEIAIAYRGQAFALRGRMGGIRGADAAAKISAARGRITAGPLAPETTQWCELLLERCDQARIALFALDGDAYAQDSAQRELVGRFEDAAAALMIAIASTLEVPARRRSIARRREVLAQAGSACAGRLGELELEAVGQVTEALDGAVALLDGRWPIGLGYGFSLRTGMPPTGLQNLIHHHDPDLLFTRHAIRLTVLIVIAMLIASLDPAGHAYWLPMTVAWVTKPDAAGTAPRVVGRISGTVVGLVVTGLAAIAFGAGLGAVMVTVAIGTFIAAAFIASNYAICTFGVTILVIALLHLSDPGIESLLGQRLLDTVIAGVLVLAVAWIWPTRLTDNICRELAATARALATYGRAALAGDREAIGAAHDPLREARLRASAIVCAAANEPPGHRLSYATAQPINSDLNRAIAIAAGIGEYERRTGREAPPQGQQLTPRSLDELDALADRLQLLPDTGHALPTSPPPDGPQTDFEELVFDAQASLDRSPRVESAGAGDAPVGPRPVTAAERSASRCSRRASAAAMISGSP
ncbi:MAG: FUSC family protein, partial [Solirubrobacterales bacterium]